MGKRNPLLYLALLAVVALNVVLVARDITSPKGFDYCAAANLRSCTVAQRGDWTLVTSGNSAYLVLMKDGKVVQISQVQ